MTPKAIKRIRWGIVSVLVLAVASLAAGSFGKKTPTASRNAAAFRSVAAGGTVSSGSSGLAFSGSQAAADQSAAVPAPHAAILAPATNTGPGALPATTDRIARTADLTVEVKKGQFDAAWKDAFRVAQRFGGQIMSSTRGVTPSPVPLPQGETQSSTAKEPAIGDITIRIPAASFIQVTGALRELGTVRGDSTTTEDVGQEYVDLQSRLRNARAEQNVLLALFGRAKTIKDTLAVQGQLSDVEGQIEQMTGRIKYLDARTLFSTVTIRLQEPGVTVIATVHEGPSLGGAWDTAKTGLVRLAGATMITALWVAPFGLLGLIGLGLWRRARPPAPQV